MAQEPWFKVLNKIGFHEKIVEVGNTAAGIWLRMMACTSTNRNDGFVSEVHVSLIVPSDQRGDLQALIDKKLIEIVPGGYHLTKYLKFNQSKSDIEKETEKESEGGKKGAETRALKKQVATGEAHPLAAEHHKLYNLYPAWHSGAAYKKWMTYCAEHINTPEQLKDLGLAIEAYKAEQKEMARNKGIRFSEHTQYIRAPGNFLEDKEDGSEFWRYVLAAHDTPIDAPTEVKKKLPQEKLPWTISVNADPDEKAFNEQQWPLTRKQQWVNDRLKDKPDDYREQWLAVHGLRDLFVAVAS